MPTEGLKFRDNMNGYLGNSDFVAFYRNEPLCIKVGIDGSIRKPEMIRIEIDDKNKSGTNRQVIQYKNNGRDVYWSNTKKIMLNDGPDLLSKAKEIFPEFSQVIKEQFNIELI